jgi:hypothetical protein
MATRRLSAAAERTPVAISPHLPPPARPSARPRSIHSSTSNISPLAPVLRWRAAVRPAPLAPASTPADHALAAVPPLSLVTSRVRRPAQVKSLQFTWNHRGLPQPLAQARAGCCFSAASLADGSSSAARLCV